MVDTVDDFIPGIAELLEQFVNLIAGPCGSLANSWSLLR